MHFNVSVSYQGRRVSTSRAQGRFNKTILKRVTVSHPVYLIQRRRKARADKADFAASIAGKAETLMELCGSVEALGGMEKIRSVLRVLKGEPPLNLHQRSVQTRVIVKL